ncbi:hypothetical protein ACRALDRAFT_211570 [Sodiomyces alcalophilus JCM 7366]|uniref:uncharacterized protein n=1 Tax=Sodiomyces alcalophilus JCM 7366 TaxID=591952 RepID=UPI0039B4610C
MGVIPPTVSIIRSKAINLIDVGGTSQLVLTETRIAGQLGVGVFTGLTFTLSVRNNGFLLAELLDPLPCHPSTATEASPLAMGQEHVVETYEVPTVIAQNQNKLICFPPILSSTKAKTPNLVGSARIRSTSRLTKYRPLPLPQFRTLFRTLSARPPSVRGWIVDDIMSLFMGGLNIPPRPHYSSRVSTTPNPTPGFSSSSPSPRITPSLFPFPRRWIEGCGSPPVSRSTAFLDNALKAAFPMYRVSSLPPRVLLENSILSVEN